MGDKRLTRRDFLRATGAAAAMAAVGAVPLELFAFDKRLVRYPEKRELLLLTSRPPLLEMPPELFRELITPNDALFVRWHLANIPTEVDLDRWRLTVGGNTERRLAFSMTELQHGFEPVTFTAVIQCAGNGRSFFEPPVPGGQWGNGAIGNVTWTGVRLRDLLARAGMKKGSVEVAFNGLDNPPLHTVPDFIKSLPLDLALDEEVLVAYAMNGAPLPMLNGFPARLIVPGWYATYWVKALSEITVLTKPSDSFWMTTAYRAPDTPCACVPPGGKPQRTVPLSRMNTRSLIVAPSAGAHLPAGRETDITGVAFSGGYGIRDVIVSVDGGMTWREAQLGKDLGRHSWIQWRYSWRPEKPGAYRVMARATNTIGESQPFESLWNPAGYRWNRIETVDVTVGQEGRP